MPLVTTRYLNRRLDETRATANKRLNLGGSGSGGGITYDYLFVGSKKITPPERTTDFLKVNLDGSGSSWVAAMPETQDEDAVVIDVTKNRIYIHGAFGGA
jgi:hypothetical protein